MSTQISGQITQVYTKIKDNIGKVIVGKSETVDMLLVMRDCLKEKGQTEKAAKYQRIAKGILEVFEREEGETFRTHDFYRWDREKLEELS